MIHIPCSSHPRLPIEEDITNRGLPVTSDSVREYSGNSGFYLVRGVVGSSSCVDSTSIAPKEKIDSEDHWDCDERGVVGFFSQSTRNSLAQITTETSAGHTLRCLTSL